MALPDENPKKTDAVSPLLPTGSDTWFLYVLAGLVTILMCVQVARLKGFGLHPATVIKGDAKSEFKIDINRSSWVEWAQLPNIGETTARRIVDDRKSNGPFASVTDLTRVSGIGEATLQRLRPWLVHQPAPQSTGPAVTVEGNPSDVVQR